MKQKIQAWFSKQPETTVQFRHVVKFTASKSKTFAGVLAIVNELGTAYNVRFRYSGGGLTGRWVCSCKQSGACSHIKRVLPMVDTDLFSESKDKDLNQSENMKRTV